MDPIISIIVPIYKVEDYLRKCIDSILTQTFTNFELILVNDGSPDNCGSICDDYAKIDNRIKVIHKSNGGLSSARNAGLDIANGKYIGFVDSDDWLEKDMYATLFEYIKRYDADISVCGRYRVGENIFKEINNDGNIIVYNRENAMRELLSDNIKSSAWDKLYKVELFKGIRYPENKFYEDIYTTHKVFARADTIVKINLAKYYYVIRQDSIVGSVNNEKRYHCFSAIKDQFMIINKTFPKLSSYSLRGLVSVALPAWLSMMSNKSEFKLYISQIELTLLQNFWRSIVNRHIPLKQKLFLVLMKLNKNLFFQFYTMWHHKKPTVIERR